MKGVCILSLCILMLLAGCSADTEIITEQSQEYTTGLSVTGPEGTGTQPDPTEPEWNVTEPTEPEIPTQPSEEVPDATEPEVTDPTTEGEQPVPEEELPMHNHSFMQTVIAPTCTAKGYTLNVCNCGDYYESDNVKATGHSYTSEDVAATCTNPGYKLHRCTICGDSYKDNTVAATGHTWSDWTTTVEPTYVSWGEQQRKCACCGESEVQRLSKLEMTAEMKQQEVLRLVNIEREKAGVPPLEYYAAGQTAADIRAKEINGKFSHTRPDGTMCWTALSEQNIDYLGAGENIAYGYPTPQAVVNGWMNSEGHRENILNPGFTHIIVGVNAAYWVQLFLVFY